MRAILLKPGKAPVECDIENELKPMQQIIGGFIDVHPYRDNMLFVFNEEGKVLNMPPNLYLNYNGYFFDVIAGPVIVLGSAGENMVGLTDEQIKYCLEDLKDHRVIL